MSRRLTVGLLCFCVAGSTIFPAHSAPLAPATAGLGKEFAGARIIHVAPEEYPALASRLSREGYRESGEPLLLGADEARRLNASSRAAAVSEECRERNRDRTSSDESFRMTAQITDDLLSGRSGRSEAVIVFVVVGTVVLVVWTLYLFKYLYDLSLGLVPCGRWSELTFTSSSITHNADQHARFSGVRYAGGVRDGYTDIGLSAEIGHSDIRLTEADALHLEGLYWWVGPLLRWRFDDSANPDQFQLEFMAGSTEHEEMGLLALARAGLSFGVGEGFRWGVNFGAMNINLNGNQGIITDRSQYHYLLGLELGYRF